MFSCFDCSNRIFQYLAAIAANLGMFSIGLHYGWPSTSLPLLTSGGYTFQMNKSDASWLVAVTPLGAFIGDVFAGFTLNTFGRKRMIMISSIPLTLSWIMIAVADSSLYLFVGRILAGIVDGLLFTAIPPYLAEVAEPKIRGFLCTTYFVTLVFGMLMSNIMLSFISIPTTAYIAASISIIMLAIMPLLPESPYFHLMKNNPLLAKASLQKFRGQEEVVEELNRMYTGILEEEKFGKGSFLELITNQHIRRCLYLTMTMTALQQLSGILAIQSYSVTVFQETSDILDPGLANIIYYIFYFLATIVALVMVDISGRRPLILVSKIIVCLTLFTNGTFLYLKTSTNIDIAGFQYIQIISLLVFTSAYSIGLNNVPVLVSSEIFPSYIKGKAFCVINICYSLVSTIVVKYFSWSTDMFGMFVPFYSFGVFTFIGIIVIALYLPETKHKTLEDIQVEMQSGKNKNTNVL